MAQNKGTFRSLKIGDTIGILGGGQLGRMLAMAAARLGFKVHIYNPIADCPACQIAHAATVAAYDDEHALCAFADAVDVITYEFENIPISVINTIESQKTFSVYPNKRALEISQDRLQEKQFFCDLGLSTTVFYPINDLQDLVEITGQRMSLPAILKTRRFGYDGKGQYTILSSAAKDLQQALNAVNNVPCILETKVDFQAEISVIVARGFNGDIVCYDVGENIHKNGILQRTSVPAKVPKTIQQTAVINAGQIARALDYCGVLGVEFFVMKDDLLVNEIAPRVHNSGHWTQNGCVVDQFEQHIRAIIGWPLGNGQRHSNVIMHNLIGTEIDRIHSLMSMPKAAVHVYGKSTVRAGRKMGHVNHVSKCF